KARASWSVHSERTVEKYILYWTLDVCEGEAKHRKTPSRLTLEATTHKREFDLFGLESSCVYELTIHTVNFSGDRGEGQKQFFRTPPCWKTNGRTSSVICRSKASPPSPPGNVAVSLQPTCACQAVVSWQHQQQSQHAQHSGGLASDHARTAAEPSGYSVRWGQSRTSGKDIASLAVVFNAEPHSINVSASVTQACLNFLTAGTHYTVQVYTLSTPGGRSSPAVRHFTTPRGVTPCFSFSNVEDMLRATEIQLVERTNGGDLRKQTTSASVYPRSSSVSLHRTASVFARTVMVILALTCVVSYHADLIV
ncbi:hypothetical protein EGW08_006214, partial [Elysia chlorotica]